MSAKQLFLAALVVAIVGGATAPASAMRHQPPVDAAVLDPFRAPPEPWLAGNRGIEYDTEAGDVIRASAPGVVAFAGAVAGDRHVTIRHSPELVTTAAFVGEVLVAAGDTVAAGDPIAIAAGPFHFTARRRGRYFDPAELFEVVRYGVRLVPVE